MITPKEIKQLLTTIIIIIGITALTFSIYTNYQMTQKQVLFTEDIEEFKTAYIDGAYDLKFILGEPTVFENFYDSCNERELNEMIVSLNNSVNHLEQTIKDFKKLYPSAGELNNLVEENREPTAREKILQEELNKDKTLDGYLVNSNE